MGGEDEGGDHTEVEVKERERGKTAVGIKVFLTFFA